MLINKIFIKYDIYIYIYILKFLIKLALAAKDYINLITQDF